MAASEDCCPTFSPSLLPPPSSSTTFLPTTAAYLSVLSGTSSGLTKLVLGYPLDLAKTLLQTTPPSSFRPGRFATARALTTTVKTHGVRGLYVGATIPAVGWSTIDGLMLGALWESRRWLFDGGKGRLTEADPVWWMEGGVRVGEGVTEGDGRRLTLWGHLLAGSIGGACVAPLSHPIDLIKCKLQVQLRPVPHHRYTRHPMTAAPPSLPSHLFHPSLVQQRCLHTRSAARFARMPPPPTFSSPLHAFVVLVRDKALYRGIGWTVLLRTGMGTLFCSYEVLLRTLRPTRLPSAAKTFLAGSIASLAFWTVFLPADNIKARIITDSHTHPRYRTSKSVIRAIWKEGGRSPKAFWRGGGAQLLRAGPVNGCAILVWEAVMRSMGERSLS